MQVKSTEYKTALYSSCMVRSTISGSITTQDGIVYQITDKDILPGSLKINNKCVNGSSFEFGAVYQGELSVQLKKEIDRYRIIGGRIEFTEHRYIKEEQTEDVFLGTYYISEPSRSKSILSIKALDRMDNFDKELEDTVVGTVFQLLNVAAEQCGMELEQGEDYFNSLPNGQIILSAHADTTDTYRDMIAYIGMITGTFGTIVNDKLRMRAYSFNPDIEITENKRNNTVIEDYETYYSAITARFIANENYAPYEYVDEASPGGLLLDMGDIPIVRGTVEEKHRVVESIYQVLKKIRYTPASFSLLTSDGALELGDKVRLEGGVETYITSLTYTYHGSEGIKGAGDNPRLKTGDKNTKRINNLEESISAKNLVVHSYTNAAKIFLEEKEKEIISINYAATEKTHPVFLATIPFFSDKDGNIIFRYYSDGVLMPEETIKKYINRGNHFLTFSNNMVVDKNQRRTLSIRAFMEFCESDIRKQEARISSIEQYIKEGVYQEKTVDTSTPKAVIEKGTIKAVLYAQGMAGTEEWDGTINLTDYVNRVSLNTVETRKITDKLREERQLPRQNAFRESVYKAEIGRLTVRGLFKSVLEESKKEE